MPKLSPITDDSCYAVIFASLRRSDFSGYDNMAAEIEQLALQQPGFLGMDSARGADGVGVTVSYWQSEEDIAAWKRHARHLVAQRYGQERWYSGYTLRVARIERGYSGPEGRVPVATKQPAGT